MYISKYCIWKRDILDNMFIPYKANKPLTLKEICRNKIRSSIEKPIQQGVENWFYPSN